VTALQVRRRPEKVRRVGQKVSTCHSQWEAEGERRRKQGAVSRFLLAEKTNQQREREARTRLFLATALVNHFRHAAKRQP
jgi:hypothetical protein